MMTWNEHKRKIVKSGYLWMIEIAFYIEFYMTVFFLNILLLNFIATLVHGRMQCKKCLRLLKILHEQRLGCGVLWMKNTELIVCKFCD